MSTMAETQGQRGNNYHKNEHGYSHRNHGYSQQMSRANYGQVYGMQHSHATANLLAHGIQGMSMHESPYSAQNKSALMAAAPQYAGITLNTGIPAALWGANSHLVYPGTHSYPNSNHQQSPGLYTPLTAQYLQHGYAQQHENSPVSQAWTPSHTTGEVPTLITPRRDSVSSAENDAPGTPSYSGYPYQAGVAILNRSPSGMYLQGTPSPSQVISQYGMPLSKVSDTRNDGGSISPEVHKLVTKEPPIPQAIPAPSSPLKPLDRALENIRGETNVYIRGLHPETTDEMLESWGRRFGDIRSSKSIIDHATGLCKGFGFVKYHNYEDAENCIRGFHYLGYEVSFARESFYSKLKTFSDESNTNLYVSNLPKSMNEHELAGIFGPHKVCSARILRDKNGTGRGVGFARFESRNVCEEVIRQFNNKTIKSNGEDHVVQIRYADTHEQKQLKQQTAAARQFRSAEYEYATQAHKQGVYSGSGRMSSYSSSVGHENVSPGNEFETYLGTSSARSVPSHGQRWTQSALRNLPARTPLANLPVNTGAHNEDQGHTEAPTSEKKPAVAASPAIAHGDNSPTVKEHA